MEKKYKRDFIVNYVIRFDFVSTLSIEQNIKDLEKKLSDHGFSLIETNMMNALNINVNNNEPSLEKLPSEYEYVFSVADKNSRFKISNKCIIYESNKYSGYSSIETLVEKLVEVLISKYSVISFSRVGMRYINFINMPFKKTSEILDWDKYIVNNYILPINGYEKKENLLQFIQQYDVKSENDNNLLYRIQLGVPNTTFPAELISKNFLIDLDGYTKNAIESSDSKETLKNLHTELSELFESMITDELRSLMNE